MSAADNSSIRSFQPMEIDSDKDLVINSLRESLEIHKEILERIQNEKEMFQQRIEKEKKEQEESFEEWKIEAEKELIEEEKRCSELQKNIAALKQELEAKKEAYQQLEVNFYSYVKTIRVTDDDLSTIQPEISHLLSQLNNTCMGLKSKMDRKGGTEFVYRMYPDKTEFINRYMTPVDGILDTSYITLFVEKYLIHMLLTQVMDVPIHLGVSINDAFRELHDWMSSRNKEWSNRLRQQVCALVVQQPGSDEEEKITKAKEVLLAKVVDDLADVYPSLKQDSKKIENLITRSLKLNLAVKGQEIKIERLSIVEGVTQFDAATMKATAKGKANGIVGLAITPPFVAKDEIDDEHGFTVQGKVFCIEQNLVEEESGDELKSQEDKGEETDNESKQNSET
ncbi:hypothetical protein G6F57_000580 [Rhizopus arrhizus]|uniref:Uncharacterized protein n=1 Tax=Rhizopus oryzae TaxID=64495 RepID=A0A9P7BS14_RHIOR|nr:hypothetical protein G6F23_002738 [Rhizopus arrhizus]KAG1420803.1 hypothetical protein G6F58_004029 [Rhizopus delemar]KAG0762462.1 hypothetical protein G6F24_006785 [Rhizopus arrhizus]KAG0775854.1 hypothetical protein G6F22_012995 [Rhizopus arrhizus]KAG0789291.1 hypothetical protein G6F21_006615 [Rhizopus arrhizus]